jgi:hypothetical protein
MESIVLLNTEYIYPQSILIFWSYYVLSFYLIQLVNYL